MDEIKEKLKKIILEDLKLNKLRNDVPDDLILFGTDSQTGFDSIDYLSLCSAVENIFGVSIDKSDGLYLKSPVDILLEFVSGKEDKLKRVRTINTIAEYIYEYKKDI